MVLFLKIHYFWNSSRYQERVQCSLTLVYWKFWKIFDHFENVQIEHHLECDNLSSSLGWHAAQPLGHCFVQRFLEGPLRYYWRNFLAPLCYMRCCWERQFFGSILSTFVYEFSSNVTSDFDIIFIIKSWMRLISKFKSTDQEAIRSLCIQYLSFIIWLLFFSYI